MHMYNVPRLFAVGISRAARVVQRAQSLAARVSLRRFTSRGFDSRLRTSHELAIRCTACFSARSWDQDLWAFTNLLDAWDTAESAREQ